MIIRYNLHAYPRLQTQSAHMNMDLPSVSSFIDMSSPSFSNATPSGSNDGKTSWVLTLVATAECTVTYRKRHKHKYLHIIAMDFVLMDPNKLKK